ncbi:enoyl-CoA hydratase-related protein [Undibacterium arcticum]
METYQDILVDRPQDDILLITLNRPDARNALRNNSLLEITETLCAAAADATIRVVVITGSQKVFLQPVPTSRKWHSLTRSVRLSTTGRNTGRR